MVLVLGFQFGHGFSPSHRSAVRQVRVRIHSPIGKLSPGAPDGTYQENGFHPQRRETVLNLHHMHQSGRDPQSSRGSVHPPVCLNVILVPQGSFLRVPRGSPCFSLPSSEFLQGVNSNHGERRRINLKRPTVSMDHEHHRRHICAS